MMWFLLVLSVWFFVIDVELCVLLLSLATDLDTLIEHTRYYMLLARVYLRKGNLDESMQHLTMARDLQTRVLKRAQVEQPDAVPAQKALAAQ